MNEMVERFIATASAYPESTAVQDQGRGCTYSELLAMTRRAASHFTGIAESPRVLICLPQSTIAYAAELGVLMAGGTFCPVDASLPDSRIAEIADIFQPHFVCTHGSPSWSEGVRRVDVSEPALASHPTLADSLRPEAEHAYVIFTSGSTGRPKGVKIRSRSLPPFFDWLDSEFGPSPMDRWAQFSRLGFDLSIVDILGSLTSGATLIPVTSPADRLLPGRFITRESITIWHSVPSMIPAIVEQGHITNDALACLRIASFCGEPLYRYYLDDLFNCNPNLLVFNTYGPTEGTLFCSYQPLTVDTYEHHCQDTAAIGEAIPGWHLILTSSVDGASPESFTIVVAGDHIGAGYVGGTEADNARFTTVEDGSQVLPAFHTGDIVRRVGEQLYFEGRADRQIKIRGQRLELGEVEAAVLDLGAREVHAFLEHGKLVAAVRGTSIDSELKLRQSLRGRVPDHAIPSRILFVTEFPRLSSGKIDYAALKQSLA